VDIVEIQTGRINDTRASQQQSDPYLYSLLNSRAIVGKQVGRNTFVGLSTGLCFVNANNFKDNFGLKVEYRFNSLYTAQAGIELTSTASYAFGQQITFTAQVNSPVQIQQATIVILDESQGVSHVRPPLQREVHDRDGHAR